MTLEELATHLAAAPQGLGLTIGTNLYRGPLPDATGSEPAVGLVPRIGGRASEQEFGAADLAFEWPRLRVVVRGARQDPAPARAKAEAIYKVLGKVQAQALSGTFYHGIKCFPVAFDRSDANDRPIYVFDIEVEKEVSAA
ncbi:MAG: minor capsid protein [Acidobacteriota bacterium]|nr:minor capsid protein [Acidobacteriota bacterium]